MSVRDEFDAERNVLILTVEGTATDEDLLKYAQKTAGTDLIPSDHDVLVDLRAADIDVSVRSQTLRRIADLYTSTDRQPEETRVAMVATGDLAYGLSRMYQAFRSDSPVDLRVFRVVGEAREWLGLPPE